MRLGITVVFLGHDGRRWFGIAQTRGLLSSPSALCSLTFGYDMRPRWLFVGTNSEVKVGKPMRDSSNPT